jgi:hypothetical protein
MLYASMTLTGETQMTPHTRAQVAKANHTFQGAIIESVRFLDARECEALGWDQGTFVFQIRLKNGDRHAIYASQDDEGNGPGAMFTTHEEHQTLWVDVP